MAILRNKRKLAALNKDDCEEHPRSNLVQNSNVLRSQEGYITQISEEIEGRLTKKLSQEFSRTENRILCALAQLDDFLMNPLIQGHSRTAPETSWNKFSTNQGTNEEDSQRDPHPEAGIFHNQTKQNFGPEDRHDTRNILFVKLCLIFHRKMTLQSKSRFNEQHSTQNFGFLFNKKAAVRDAFYVAVLSQMKRFL